MNVKELLADIVKPAPDIFVLDNPVIDYAERWWANGWTHIACGCCAGIEWGGEEPRECRDCGGGGSLWQSPKGRLALYPGGPFRGRAV